MNNIKIESTYICIHDSACARSAHSSSGPAGPATLTVLRNLENEVSQSEFDHEEEINFTRATVPVPVEAADVVVVVLVTLLVVLVALLVVLLEVEVALDVDPDVVVEAFAEVVTLEPEPPAHVVGTVDGWEAVFQVAVVGYAVVATAGEADAYGVGPGTFYLFLKKFDCSTMRRNHDTH